MTSASTRFFGQPRLTRLTLYLFKRLPPQSCVEAGIAKNSSNIRGVITQNRPGAKTFLRGGCYQNRPFQEGSEPHFLTGWPNHLYACRHHEVERHVGNTEINPQ